MMTVARRKPSVAAKEISLKCDFLFSRERLTCTGWKAISPSIVEIMEDAA
jgi:hypothetical protein